MKKYSYAFIMTLISLLVLGFLAGCEKNWKPTGNGELKGTISIGPLCPVERIPPDPGCLPTAETYKAYPVSIFTSGRESKVTTLNPTLDGSFSLELPEGKYIMVLDREINIGSSNLPEEISISNGDTTKVTINIDTGIR